MKKLGEIIKRYDIKALPSDHIISIGKMCNSDCLYCISSSPQNKKLNKKTAKKIIDFIFSIPRNDYYIEITGGEPFENYNTTKYIVEYASKKSIKENKKIHFSIVSNLINITKEHLLFILKNKITIATSIDGSKDIHNTTRKSVITQDSYSKTISNLKKLIYYSSKGIIEKPNLITTITKYSLPKYKEIIDEYIKLNIMRVQLGFLEPIGKANKIWKEIGYSYKEYSDFYSNAIDYILFLNMKKNIPIYEKGAFLVIRTLIDKKYPKQRAIDIVNRLCYDFNGNIYPSDETRILGEELNKEFLLGNVFDKDYKKFITNKKTLLFLIKNFQELIYTKCSYCKYFYICKIQTHCLIDKDMFNERCKFFKRIFEIIEERFKKNKDIFLKWLYMY